MDKYGNIEEYRRKKRMKQWTRKIILIILIFSILFVLLFVLKQFKGIDIKELIKDKENSEEIKYPLIIKNEQMLDIDTYGNKFSILTKANLITYDIGGKKEPIISHGYTNPVSKTNSKKILTYDRGANKLFVGSQTNKMKEVSLENEIITAELSHMNETAVVTKHDRYASVLTIFNESLSDEIFKFYCTEEITSVCFSENGKDIIALAITINNGVISTNVYHLKTNQEKQSDPIMVTNLLPLSVTYSNNNEITIVGKDNLASVNLKNKNIKYFEYKGNIQYFCKISESDIALINKNQINSFSTLSIISSDFKIKATTNIDDEIIDFYTDGSRCVVLGKKSAYNFDMSLKLLNEIKLQKNFKKVIIVGSELYMLSSDCLDKQLVD